MSDSSFPLGFIRRLKLESAMSDLGTHAKSLALTLLNRRQPPQIHLKIVMSDLRCRGLASSRSWLSRLLEWPRVGAWLQECVGLYIVQTFMIRATMAHCFPAPLSLSGPNSVNCNRTLQQAMTVQTIPNKTIFVVSGPAGSGKSTVATYVSQQSVIPYLEGDDVHFPFSLD
jgi:hypothetical protein